ncbi:MAG: DUF4003 family protein [Clostridium sp.]
MKKAIKNICDLTIENYMTANEVLRYDGTYINHFAGVLYSSHNKELDGKNVKDIRKYIKNNTSRMSFFRGDILYILSLLIGVHNRAYEKFCDKVIEVYERLIEEDFEESAFLVLPAYALSKYVKEENIDKTIENIKKNYKLLKEKNVNVTNGEDYLICTLLAIKDVNISIINRYFEDIEEYAEEEEELSNNEVQGLTTAMALNFKFDLSYNIEKLLEELNRREIRVSNKFVHILGVLNYEKDIKSYVDNIEKVVEYLCEEEASYEFYMDKSFRTIIALSIIEGARRRDDSAFMDELLALGMYSFLVSKNQDVFARGLA